LTLGIICDDTLASGFFTDSIAFPAFISAIPIIAKLSEKYGIGPHHNFDAGKLLSSSGEISVGQLGDLPGGGRQRHCLATQLLLFFFRLVSKSD
jgi:glucan endo-1,6-beta-glucosidase